MSTVGRLSKLVDRKVVPQPNKATIIRVDQITVDLQISAGSGTIHHVSVQGDISQLTPGMVVPIQWTERDGGYLAPVVIATGNAVVSGVVPSIIVDNQTIQSVDGELQVRPGGIETRHLAFVPSVEGHSHPSELATAGLQTREGRLENVAQDIALTGSGRIETDGLIIDGSHATYRLWAGAEDPEDAPFSIEADGTVNGMATGEGSITVEEADGTPSVDGVNKIKVPNGTLTNNGSGVVTLASPLTVEESDGTPSVAGVSKIKVANGSLTNNGSGVVTLGAGLTVEESDGSPSVANVKKIKVPNNSLTDLTGGDVYIGSGLRVYEADGSPSIYNTAILRFPNGTLTDNGSGDVTFSLPNFPKMCRVYRTGNYTLTNSGTLYAIPFDYERIDDGNLHNNSTNNTRITVATTGYYFIFGDAAFAAHATGVRDLYIRVDGSTLISGQRQQAPVDSGRGAELGVATIYYLNANQYVELIARQYSGGSLDVLASANNSPEFGLIGPLCSG